jgi:hypothetical protein
MEFYLNQKSLPMIRKCANCKYFHRDFKSCSLLQITNAYDHKKKIFLQVGENLYCNNHTFRNEDFLKKEAIVVEYESLSQAMEVINKNKMLKDVKNSTYNEDSI